MTTETRENLFLRDDTFFGVCEALGEDLHIPSNLFRLALAPLLIWNPVATILGYLVVGCVIAAIRFVFPSRRRSRAAAAQAPVTMPEVDNDDVGFAKAA